MKAFEYEGETGMFEVPKGRELELIVKPPIRETGKELKVYIPKGAYQAVEAKPEIEKLLFAKVKLGLKKYISQSEYLKLSPQLRAYYIPVVVKI